MTSIVNATTLTPDAEAHIARFERLWQGKTPPSPRQLQEIIQQTDDQTVQFELLAIDMEFRWNQSSQLISNDVGLGPRPTWRDYQFHLPFPLLIERLPANILAEEYRHRRKREHHYSSHQFIGQYPQREHDLRPVLHAIDAEFLSEAAIELGFPQARSTLPTWDWSDFLLKRMVGQGGFGKVYEAWHRSAGCLVAIKALRKEHQRDPDIVTQFLQEGQALAQLRHPHIVKFFGIGTYPGGGRFLVMEMGPTHNLQDFCLQHRLTFHQAISVIKSIAQAINFSHHHGILHGDLKPHNVLYDGVHLAVTDFGLARFVEQSASNACVQALGATQEYSAPEVLQHGRLAPRADVYSLGKIFAFLLPNWKSGPKSIVELVDRCLEKNVSKRMADVGVFLQQLEEAERYGWVENSMSG